MPKQSPDLLLITQVYRSNEPVVRYSRFVMNTEAEASDYQNGKDGFSA